MRSRRSHQRDKVGEIGFGTGRFSAAGVDLLWKEISGENKPMVR